VQDLPGLIHYVNHTFYHENSSRSKMKLAYRP
jgi:hypothetical protein